ncbi:MAG: hypothetical protein EOP11_26295, partial [Proteobacteria bacterium]
MKLLAVFLGLLACSSARADILFLDLNFSPAEIVAARAVAKARGEQLLLYPERSDALQAQLDPAYRESQAKQATYYKCIRETQTDCTKQKQSHDASRKKLDTLVARLTRVNGPEFGKIAAGLAQANTRLTAIVFSGHSGGNGSFTGTLGTLNLSEIREAFEKNPGPVASLRSILLWGCYAGTFHSLRTLWQLAFPTVKAFVGFERQSPLGIRESSGRYLRSYLANENGLLNARTLSQAHGIFRKLDLVAPLDGSALVGDWYFTYEQAFSVTEMESRCQSFDPKLYEAYLCYQEGKKGCEQPPGDHRGPLRELYSFLQVNRH